MSFTNNPAERAVDRMRLATGDIDEYEEGLTDEVYEYLLTANNNNESLAVVAALKYLIAKYSNYVTEKAGQLFVKESERVEQYQKLFKMYTANPSTMILKQGVPFAGGISHSDMDTNQASYDSNQSRITLERF